MSFYPSAPMGKKTSYYKYKEKEKDKQKREEDESAKLYEHFVESFETRPESRTTQFVRGETILQGSKQMHSEQKVQTTRSEDTSRPAHIRHGLYSSISSGSSRPQERPQVATHAPVRKSSKGKPKHIDIMLENIKREQEERAMRARVRKTGFDIMTEKPVDVSNESLPEANSSTTNLYVGGLAPDLTEDILKREFGKFGAIASVKIMWPRDEDQVKRGSNVGFVAFMERECAAKCIEKLNGEKLHGMELRIGWGKSVPLPSVPVFASSSSAKEISTSSAMIDSAFKKHLPLMSEEPSDLDIKVAIPDDIHLRYVIDTLAAYVVKDGPKFEQLIKRKESTNPVFAFLYEDGSAANIYYRWKLFSLVQGDSMKCWRLEPFYMIEGESRWVPPTMCIGDGSQLTAAQKGGEFSGKKKLLSEMEKDKLKEMLQSLTATKKSICETMVFALNNAEAAEEIVEILAASLCHPRSPITLKITLLFLVSDILHNSSASVRNASQYRSKLEEQLPDVFESFQVVYSTLHDKKDIQETVKKYNHDLSRGSENKCVQSTFLASLESVHSDSEHLKNLESLQAEEIERKCRHSGLSLGGGVRKQKLRIARLETYLQGTSISTSILAPVSKTQPELKTVKSKPPLKRQLSSGLPKRPVGDQKNNEKRSTSLWTSVKVEKSPRVPVSQLLQKEKVEKSTSVDRKDTVTKMFVMPMKKKPVAMQKEDFDMFEEEPESHESLSRGKDTSSRVSQEDDSLDFKRQKTNNQGKSRFK